MSVLFFLLALAPAWADPAPVKRPAEYQRLSEDMARMAKVGNWGAVERSFQRLDGISRDHTFKVLLNAAYAARETGNLTEAKARLLGADALKEDDAVREWLWSIQSDYEGVFLAADLAGNFRLYPVAMPFMPEHRRAVEFAADQVKTNGRFEGLLPKGEYVFRPLQEETGPYVFPFDLSRERLAVDLRTREEISAADRRKRKRLDKKLLRQGITD